MRDATDDHVLDIRAWFVEPLEQARDVPLNLPGGPAMALLQARLQAKCYPSVVASKMLVHRSGTGRHSLTYSLKLNVILK